MGVDLTMVPWNRLSKLAPPGTKLDELQDAADRHSLNTDLNAALADLWEEAANCIDLGPDPQPEVDPTAPKAVKKVSQDGITVEYADDPTIGGTRSARISQHSQYMRKARFFRQKAKPSSPLVHQADYNPWLNTGYPHDDAERIIVVDEV